MHLKLVWGTESHLKTKQKLKIRNVNECVPWYVSHKPNSQ